MKFDKPYLSIFKYICRVTKQKEKAQTAKMFPGFMFQVEITQSSKPIVPKFLP